MMHFDEWWNSAAADSFRAKHEDLDGEAFRTVWDAAQLGQAAIKQAAVPQGWKLVQIELLERIQESLGSFISDQGWSQSDMDTADALGGLLAAAPQVQADARDAARYRWLRDNDWRNDEKMEPVIRLHLNAIWDEKIDAAMAAQARNKKGIEQ